MRDLVSEWERISERSHDTKRDLFHITEWLSVSERSHDTNRDLFRITEWVTGERVSGRVKS